MIHQTKPRDSRAARPGVHPPASPAIILTRARHLGHITVLLLADRPLSAAEWAEIEAAERSAS